MSNKIKQAMDRIGMNQTELAVKVNVTPQAVQQWISGKTMPKGKRLLLLSKVLGVSQSWLLGEEDNTLPVKHPIVDLTFRQKCVLTLFESLPIVDQDKILAELEEKSNYVKMVIEDMKSRSNNTNQLTN